MISAVPALCRYWHSMRRSLSTHERLQPFRQWPRPVNPTALVQHGNFSKRTAEIAVIEDQDVRQHPDGGLEVRQGSRVTGLQLPGRHIVAALRIAHGNTFRRDFRSGQADIAQLDGVTDLLSLPQKCQIASGGIGENGFKDKAFIALHKAKPQGVCQLGTSGWVVGQFP